MHFRRATSAIALTLAIAACGGGGGSGGSTPTPPPVAVNQPPSFTSAATASVVENTVAAYQATATDPEGSAITFTISGGADAAKFAITSAGALTFVASPDFEVPTDADGNNVYLVQLRASDGSASSTLDLQVTVTNDKEGSTVKRVLTGLDQPTYLGDGYLTDKSGKVYSFDAVTHSLTLVHTATNLSTAGNGGVLAIAQKLFKFTGGFDKPFILVSAANGNMEVRRIGPGDAYTVVLTIPHPANGQYSGSLAISTHSGLMYVGTDDGGVAANAQDPFSRLGKILAIGFCEPGFVYCGYNVSPAYDPFVFALGLHSPRVSLGTDDRLYISDAGPTVQEIEVIGINDKTHPNFGWPYFEGTQAGTGTPPAGFAHTPPVAQYSAPLGSHIIGGSAGPITGDLLGRYLFSDLDSGNMWSVRMSSLVQGSQVPASMFELRNKDFEPDVGKIDKPVGLFDLGGYLFIIDSDGEIFQVYPPGTAPT